MCVCGVHVSCFSVCGCIFACVRKREKELGVGWGGVGGGGEGMRDWEKEGK